MVPSLLRSKLVGYGNEDKESLSINFINLNEKNTDYNYTLSACFV